MADMVVVDAGPLITCGNLNGFDLFPDVLGQVLVPEQVLHECLRDHARPDALHIQSAIEKRWLTVERCDSDFLESLHRPWERVNAPRSLWR